MNAVQSDSHVVVATQALVVRTLFTNKADIYQNYETMVASGARVPAEFANDTHRHAVAGRLFGSYAPEIRYGLLSLDPNGLPNYGNAFMLLRDVAIKDRVSFLHENSYTYMRDQKLSTKSQLPLGFRSDWNRRDQLAGAKVEADIKQTGTVSDWSTLLVRPKAARAEDEFIEAHIFGSFTAGAVKSVSFGRLTSRADKLDQRVIEELIAKRAKDQAE